MSENSRMLSWNVPAAVAAFSAVLWNWGASPFPIETSSQGNGGSTTASDPFLPVHAGLVSYSTGLWEDPFIGRKEALLEFENSKRNKGEVEGKNADQGADDYKDLFDGMLGDEHGRLLVMPILVEGEDSGSDAVDRIQYRHAVENALAQSGFSLDFPDRMSFAHVPELGVLRGGKRTIIDAIVPIKLYSTAKKSKSLLVLWIDRRWLGDEPLTVIPKIIQDTVLKDNHKGKLVVSIVGPNYTDDLNEFVTQAKKHPGKASLKDWTRTLHNERASIFSPAATAYGADAVGDLAKAGFDLVHIIGKNDDLITKLGSELDLRWLDRKPMILFSETGQISPQQLAGQLKAYRPTTVTFLRGVSKSTQGSASDVQDYFYRTMSGMTRVEREKYKLVGVFANVTEDKLAVLRAAKSMFPNATFFTVDLHSDFTVTENLPFTRNLLVASLYGLAPDSDQYTLPLKYRDSYQTSVFVAVTQAIQSYTTEVKSNFQPPEAKIYEIGQYAEVELDATMQGNSGVRIALAGIGLLGLLFILLSLIAPFSRSIAGWFPFAQANLWPVKKPDGPALRDSRSTILTKSKRFAHGAKKGSVAFKNALASNPKESAITLWRWIWNSVGLEILISVIVTVVFCSMAGRIQAALIMIAVFLAILCLFVGLSHFRKPLHRFIPFFGVPLLVSLWLSREPAGLFSGISVWPSAILTWLLCIFASNPINGFIQHGFMPRSSRKCNHANEFSPILEPKIEALFQELPMPLFWARAISGTVLLAMGVLALSLETAFSPPPARGDMAIIPTFFMHTLSTLLVFLLICISLVRTLTLRKVFAEIRKRVNLDELDCDKVDVARKLVSWIEDMSWQSSKDLFLPSALVLVFTLCRLPVWDGWHLNSVILTTVLIPFAMILVATIVLRREAHRVREKIVEQIRAHRIVLLKPNAAVGEVDDRKSLVKYMDDVVADIRALSRGAFRDIWHDPILGSFLLFVTSVLSGPGKEVFGFLGKLSSVF